MSGYYGLPDPIFLEGAHYAGTAAEWDDPAEHPRHNGAGDAAPPEAGHPRFAPGERVQYGHGACGTILSVCTGWAGGWSYAVRWDDPADRRLAGEHYLHYITPAATATET